MAKIECLHTGGGGALSWLCVVFIASFVRQARTALIQPNKGSSTRSFAADCENPSGPSTIKSCKSYCPAKKTQPTSRSGTKLFKPGYLAAAHPFAWEIYFLLCFLPNSWKVSWETSWQQHILFAGKSRITSTATTTQPIFGGMCADGGEGGGSNFGHTFSKHCHRNLETPSGNIVINHSSNGGR